ncbi:MAG: hypothetical protein OQL09_08560 [Gammaproteobacteria bacterium]|nr:hypothetical protein [Gammaproteobacteria bacterium]
MKNKIKPAILSLILACLINIPPVYADKQPLMQIALNNLERAEKTLQKAAWNKGGHRIKALHHVRKAIEEVKKGMEFANKN